MTSLHLHRSRKSRRHPHPHSHDCWLLYGIPSYGVARYIRGSSARHVRYADFWLGMVSRTYTVCCCPLFLPASLMSSTRYSVRSYLRKCIITSTLVLVPYVLYSACQRLIRSVRLRSECSVPLEHHTFAPPSPLQPHLHTLNHPLLGTRLHQALPYISTFHRRCYLHPIHSDTTPSELTTTRDVIPHSCFAPFPHALTSSCHSTRSPRYPTAQRSCGHQHQQGRPAMAQWQLC